MGQAILPNNRVVDISNFCDRFGRKVRLPQIGSLVTGKCYDGKKKIYYDEYYCLIGARIVPSGRMYRKYGDWILYILGIAPAYINNFFKMCNEWAGTEFADRAVGHVDTTEDLFGHKKYLLYDAVVNVDLAPVQGSAVTTRQGDSVRVECVDIIRQSPWYDDLESKVYAPTGMFGAFAWHGKKVAGHTTFIHAFDIDCKGGQIFPRLASGPTHPEYCSLGNDTVHHWKDVPLRCN